MTVGCGSSALRGTTAVVEFGVGGWDGGGAALSAWDYNMTIVILYRNKWIFGKIRVIMMLLSEMRVTIALEYRKIVNKNEFSERGWIYGSYQSGCGCSGWYVGGSVEGVFLL